MRAGVAGNGLANERPQFLLSHKEIWESFIHIDSIDDSDNRGIDGRYFAAERFAGSASLQHDQHLLVHAGADRIDSQERRPPRRVIQ